MAQLKLPSYPYYLTPSLFNIMVFFTNMAAPTCICYKHLNIEIILIYILYHGALYCTADGFTSNAVLKICLIILILALREKQDGAGLQYFICNPRKSPAKVLSLFIDLSLSIRLFQLKRYSNRGLGRIYQILRPLDGSISYPTSRPAAKQVYLGYWWTQN